MALPAGAKTNGQVTKGDANKPRTKEADLTADLQAASILDSAIEEMGIELDDILVEDDDSDVEEPTDTPDPDETEEEEESDEEAPEGDGDADETPADKSKKSSTEDIIVDGKTVTIDYSDRPAIKRAFEQAGGVDKLYSRYTELRAAAKAAETEHAERKTKADLQDILAGLYGEGGDEGAFKLLQHLSKGKAQEIAARVAKMTPPAAPAGPSIAELQAAHAEEIAKLTKSMDDTRSQTRAERAQAAVEANWSQFAFTGKLGDAHAEEAMNELVFSRFRDLYRGAEGKGTEMNSEVVRQLMTEASRAVPQAVHKAARRLVATEQSTSAKAAKRAAQNAATGGKSAKTSAAKGKKKSSQVNWMNPQDVTAFLEDNMN